VFNSLLDPPILFFIVGLLAVAARSNLRVPMPITKFLSLYLLMAIGFKGGVSLNKSGFSTEAFLTLGAGIFLSLILCIISFLLLSKKFGNKNAAAIGATYGSVSAVTFVTGVSFLEQKGLGFSGFLIAALALMEFPAIVFGVFLSRLSGVGEVAYSQERRYSFLKLVHEATFNGSVYLLLASMIVGIVSGQTGADSLAPFIQGLFKGLLGFFLLDLGLLAGKQLRRLKDNVYCLLSFAIIIPLIGAYSALFLASLIGLSNSDAFLFMCLGAGASYIAVPAALKQSIPEANAGLYLPMALGITFPFNIILGIPLYWKSVVFFLG